MFDTEKIPSGRLNWRCSTHCWVKVIVVLVSVVAVRDGANDVAGIAVQLSHLPRSHKLDIHYRYPLPAIWTGP